MLDEPQPETRTFPVREYPWTNLADLCYEEEPPPDVMPDGSSPPASLPYFTNGRKYASAPVLEQFTVSAADVRQTPLLKVLSPVFVNELFQVPDCHRAIVYLPEHVITCQGDMSDSLLVIVQGRVDLMVDGQLQRRLQHGDSFGEREFFGACRGREATAVTSSFCDVHVLYREALTKTLDRIPGAERELQRLFSTSAADGQVPLRALARFSRQCAKVLAPELDDSVVSPRPRPLRFPARVRASSTSSRPRLAPMATFRQTGLRGGRGLSCTGRHIVS